MTTIRTLDPIVATGKTKEIFDDSRQPVCRGRRAIYFDPLSGG
jgi:hypothetical protein